MGGLARYHVILTTHTTRHLRRSLMGVAAQRAKPATVVVSCDNDLEEIADAVRLASEELGIGVALVQRRNMGECRVGQARNNGVRALAALGLAGTDRLLYLDGDCCPAADVGEIHLRRGEGTGLLIGFRVELTEEQTSRFDERRVRRGELAVEPTGEQMAALEARDAKYRRQLVLKRFGLTKSHKPKLLSAHFSTSAEAMLAVNGFDEQYVGWGQEDDDLGRRLHLSGARAGVVIREAMVLHQWHPTRAAGRWDQSAGVERFRKKLPARCERGIENPVDQGRVVVRVFEGGREVERRELGGAGVTAGGGVAC